MDHALDEQFMEIALQEAALALQAGNLPIGAVIVHRGRMISKGHNQVQERRSELAHAELQAMLPVRKYLCKYEGACEIYTTLEPCMMCLGALIHYKFKRVVVAMLDPAVGALELAKYSAYYRTRLPQITSGIFPDRSYALLKQYVSQTGRSLHLLNNHLENQP